MSQGPLALQGDQACPCARAGTNGKALRFSGCCGQYLEGDAPPDAQSLMRSRYSAFVLAHVDYLLATWHSSTRPATLDFEANVKWLGLEVREHQATGADTAEVAFVARYRAAGAAVRLHERSRFVREDGRWFYVDGDQHG